MENKNSKNLAQTIRDCQDDLLGSHPESLLFGLGVNDPKRVFETTTGLVEKYGESRVFETPTAENSSLGIAVGLAISGHKPIVLHQRLDFFLLAMDQLVNSAAKWRYMFGDAYQTSMIIRLIVGRGWGQGPTHSQNLHAWFSHVPGLRVFFPTFAADFITIFQRAFAQKYPVILIEDRWLHSTKFEKSKLSEIEFGKTRVVRSGEHLTLVTFGFNTILGTQVTDYFGRIGIDIEHLDLISLKPIDFETISSSVAKTRRLVIVDSGFEIASVGSYISHQISSALFNKLLSPVEVLTSGDFPEPTSHGVIREFKIDAEKIARCIQRCMSLSTLDDIETFHPRFADVPDQQFQGPF